ncbi:MAG: 50S ribosomal protein L21 [Candidatus Aminicenantes bacterium]|nr:50S ribosomal protein L21 [Candidatus Aminicenantes bacterium]
MFAVIKSGGKQYRVSVGDTLEVERISVGGGSLVEFKEVLLIDDGHKTWLGQPYLPKALVRAQLLEEFKDDKIIVFKKKRRKQYKKKRGHRQIQSRVKILEIIPDVELKEKETFETKPIDELQKKEMTEVLEREDKAIEIETEEAEKKVRGRKKKTGES